MSVSVIEPLARALQPDGKKQTWNNDDDFWIWFERVADIAA